MASLKDLFKNVLDTYPEALRSYKAPQKDFTVCQTLIQIAGVLEDACQSVGFRTIRVRPSWGLGRWNPTPWVAFLDERITTTTQKAFYPVFLFRFDGSGVYLSLDLGTGRAKNLQKER